jgi:hypothetical protein
MAKAPTTEAIAPELIVPERVLLFCLASDTNWVKAGVSHSTAQHLLVRNLVERDRTTDFALTSCRGILAQAGTVQRKVSQPAWLAIPAACSWSSKCACESSPRTGPGNFRTLS